MKVNFIVVQCECGVRFSMMHLLQLAVHKIIVATQYVLYRFETTEILCVCICGSYILFHVDDATTPVCFARKDPKIISDSLKSSAKSYSSCALNMCLVCVLLLSEMGRLFENCLHFFNCFGTGASGKVCFNL